MMKSIDGFSHTFHEGHERDSLLGLLKIYQNFDLGPDEDPRTTYIIASDDKRGVYGGAVLYLCNISSPEESEGNTFNNFFSIFYPNRWQYWTARICLCIGNDASTSLLETVKLYQQFYQDLYKEFACFAEKRNLDYLTFALRKEDTHIDNKLHILTYELWPNLLTVIPPDQKDGLSQGILSLKGNIFPPFEEIRKALSATASLKPKFSAKESSSPNGREGA